ncbi:MAG TPA: DUF2182 domain-containing protein [Xanthomonadales bacterium]|nr:DUF2182 domain-containing protein [Xanthomonadales bacterium]
MIESLLKHDRKVVIACLVMVSLIAWAWMLAGAGMGMDGIEMTRHSLMNMDATANQEWTFSYALLMFSMWWVMMIAMMLPSASPVILLATGINQRSRSAVKPYGTAFAFASGYLLAWAGFSIVAVAIQWWLGTNELINGMLQSRSQVLSAGLLITAGIWQFTPWKQACLRHCRGPIAFLTRHRRNGNPGALIMGAHHGLFCLGCCWFLMALLFVGGVMNLIWIAGLAVYVWIEKALPGGLLTSRIAGALLIILGVSILL